MSAHSIFSPSASHRILNCPPSLMLCAKAAEQPSPYAAEGTCAHELCAYLVERALGKDVKDPTENLDYYNAEMQSCAEGYASFVMEEYEKARSACPDARVFVEQWVDISRWVPGCGGTADCIILADGVAVVIDYKHGVGVPVSASSEEFGGNPQLMCYCLGAVEMFDGIYDIDGNGIPELYFLACKDSSQVMNSSLFIYSYNENAGEALKQIEVPDIIYMAGSGGLFQMYATSNRLIITHAGGEDSDFKYWTEIYNFQWDLIASYRRNYLYDYNAPEDQATTVKYYEEEAEITEEQYNKVFKEDANNAVIVLARNYTPSPSDVEYPLVSKPSFAMLSYESAYTYLESLRS